MIITVVAGKGSPGATTAALGMTLCWPAPVLLIEADPAGGSIAFGYGRGTDLSGRGISGIRVAARHMGMPEAIWANVVTLDDDRSLLPGVVNPRQAAGVDYAGLANAVATLGVDVIIDAGRIPAATDVAPLLAASDRVLVALRATLPGVHAGQHAAATATATAATNGRSAGIGKVRSVIIGPGRPYPESDVTTAMSDIAPVVGTIARDPAAAGVLSGGVPQRRGFHRSPLMRSMTHLAVALRGGVPQPADDPRRQPNHRDDNADDPGVGEDPAHEHDAPAPSRDASLSTTAGGGRR